MEIAKEPSLGQVLKALVKHRERKQARRHGSAAEKAHKEDLLDCLEFCIGKMREFDTKTKSDLLMELDRVFGESAKKCVTLSTIHKAKGLEWHVVYILQPYSLPLDFIASDPLVPEWEQIQEQNVAYVGITRASQELLFLRHVKDLKGNGAKIVEVFGEEAGAESDEDWWDEQQKAGGDDAFEASNELNLNVEEARRLLKMAEGPATVAEVNAAYKRRALETHPDKHPESPESFKNELTELFKRVCAARDLLISR